MKYSLSYILGHEGDMLYIYRVLTSLEKVKVKGHFKGLWHFTEEMLVSLDLLYLYSF